jgi:hypothetical protein
VGGWLLLGCGIVITCATALAPAYLDVQRAQAQAMIMERQLDMLRSQQDNYRNFTNAVERGEPQLLERLAWYHLHLRPVKTELLDTPRDPSKISAPPLNEWLRPTLGPLAESTMDLAYPDTQLVRLITGPTRPWVLAFGAWLILMGLLLNGQPAVEDHDPMPLSISASSVPDAAI